MDRRDAEDGRVVAFTALGAIAGVVALRAGVGVGTYNWGLAYLAMGLTASIRWTRRGVGCSPWSLARGLACLQAGVHLCRLMGYPTLPIGQMGWPPRDFGRACREVAGEVVRAFLGA